MWYKDEIFHLMCKKALEIRKPYSKYIKGDFFLDHVYGVSVYGCGSGTHCSKPKPIWLPRQDQLQGMVKYGMRFILLETFRYWYMKTNATGKFNSMEQLWLAFVMKEKYNKIWNGNDWIKERI